MSQFQIFLLLTLLFYTGTAQIGEPKLLCYYTNWSSTRPGDSAYFPSHINTTLCTHIIYSFAVLDPNTLELVPGDEEIDLELGYYAQVTNLKGVDLKVSLAIGGWGDSRGDKYSRMVGNESSRGNFVNKAVQFLRRHNFDGLDLDWEYPSCPQADCTSGPPSDKQNFASLLRELRTAFTPFNLLLSAAVSADRTIAQRAYDIPTLNSQLDWIGLMTYDMAGGWDGATGHNSPFRGPTPNTVDTVNYWLESGANSYKLIVGVPLYGRSFTLLGNDTGVGAPARDGRPGRYTAEPGFLAYFELCTDLENFTMVPGVGPYGYSGDQWGSFDDEVIIGEKTAYVNEMGLAGAMVWAVDLDDFNGGFCGKGAYPLMNALRNGLGINK